MTPCQKIELAKQKMQKLVDKYIELVNIQAANKIINYSDTLASQIPTSRAAHAFNYFQTSIFRYELVQLMTIYDRCQKDDYHKISIPAVLNLIDDADVISKLKESAYSDWLGSNDRQWAEMQSSLIGFRLEFAIRWGRRLSSCPRVASLMNFRDKHLAHTLEITRMEQRTEVANPRYGDERKLLLCAKYILNSLYLGINSISFDWNGSKNIAERNAIALWSKCKFENLK